MKSVLVFLVMVCCSSVPGFTAELPSAAVVKAAKEAFLQTVPAKPVSSGTLVQPFGPFWDKSGVYVLFPGQKWRNSENGKPGQAVAIAPGVVQRGTDAEWGPYLEIVHSDQIKSQTFLDGSQPTLPSGTNVSKGAPLGTAKEVFFQLFFRADASGQWEIVDPVGFGIR